MASTRTKSGYLPSLDGWRCFAILGVLMAHDKRWHFFGHNNAHVRDFGGLGVQLFFAISGILICGRILDDEAVRGSFRLRDFYVRRLFRIQPAALVYLAAVALLMLFGIVHDRWHFWLGALFLYHNFIWHSLQMDRMLSQGWFTGQFWTLAVEEHFYILLSLFLFFCKRHRLLLLSLGLLLLLLTQAWLKSHGHYSPDVSSRRTYWCVQNLFAAALAAMLLRIPAVRAGVVRFLKPWVAFTSTAVLMFAYMSLNYGFRSFFFPSAIGYSWVLLSYAFCFWVVASMLHPHSWTTRFLELAPLRFIGRLSYSIYLWHILFFSVGESWPHITWGPLVAAGVQPWRYVSTFCAALLSYYLVEKPMIRLGHRLSPPATPGHADLSVQEPLMALA